MLLLKAIASSDKALSTAELAAAADSPGDTIGPVVAVLMKRKLVLKGKDGNGTIVYSATGDGVAVSRGEKARPKRASPAKKRAKSRKGRGPAKTGQLPVRTRRSVVSVDTDDSAFRVGLLDDASLLIINGRRGSLRLTPDESASLAGFCHEHFAAA